MNHHFAQKLEIFVGATKRDLGEARRAIIEAILEKGHIPSGMELWAAGHRPPLTVIAQHLARCDAHILVLGARYGSIIDGIERISFTEWEYRQSHKKRPILAFVLDGKEFKRALRKEKDAAEKENRKQLEDLHAELLREKFVKHFTNDETGWEKLKADTFLALDELVSSGEVAPEAGWIRADSLEARTLRDLALNPFLRRELDQLHRFSTVGRRVGQDVASKEIMAKVFWNAMQGRIRRYEYDHLFFESGSTLAYVSDEFEKTVLRPGLRSYHWHIRTNNVLCLVQFDLHTSIDAARFPAGVPDPDDPYGAIFPNEWFALHEPPPMKPRKLHQAERDAVETMCKKFCGHSNEKQLVLATASGLDLDNSEPDFRGPHVGSHPNMLFKRAILSTQCPVALFLNAEKLGGEFKRGKCYPVFGPDDPWCDVIKNRPMAICVGYEWPKTSPSGLAVPSEEIRRRNNPGFIRSTLNSLGFTEIYADEEQVSMLKNERHVKGAILLANKRFSELLPAD